MKKYLFILLSFISLIIISAYSDIFARSYKTSDSDVYVDGYYRKDGTYVSPYYRSSPDGIISNNYSCIDYGICGGSNYTSTYTSKNYSTTYSEKKQASCTKKYPGTIYRIEDDMCICSNGGDYDSKTKTCITNETRNQRCNVKYPGTTYQSEGDKCVCTNGVEFDVARNSCFDRLADKCRYSDGTGARVGDTSSDGRECKITGKWSCKNGYEWDTSNNKCILMGDLLCKKSYGENSIWSRRMENGKYTCSCLTGFAFLNNQCVQIQGYNPSN